MSAWPGRSIATLRSLAETSERVLDERDLPRFYDQIVQVALAELEADSCALMLWDGSGEQLLVAAAAGTHYTLYERIPLKQSFAGQVVTRCEPMVLEASTNSPDFQDLLRYEGQPSAAGVPLFGQGHVLGALLVVYQQSSSFDLADRDFLSLLASQVVIAIEHVRVRSGLGGAVGGASQGLPSRAQKEKLSGMVRLVAALAHEINNPLHAIHNSLHLLLNRPLDEDKRARYLEMAQEQVEQLIELVQRMLSFYQPVRDGMRPTAIHTLLGQSLRLVAEQMSANGVQIERDWSEGLPRVMATASHLKHVFQHLALNAIEAMPQGGKLTIRTSVLEQRLGDSEQTVLVEFSDTGPGISDSQIKTIFEPFYTTKSQNTGLGLAISYSIVERHGGVLSVYNDGAQTIFRVALPALRESATADDARSLSATQHVEQ